MVVNGYEPYSLYVYQSYSPYNIVARVPLNGGVFSVVISDDNTMAVSHDDYDHAHVVSIYHYDGKCPRGK